jgi:rare lipoprotein A
VRRVLLVIAAAATVAACSSSGPSVGFKPKSKEYFSERTYGRASPRVAYSGPIRKGGGRVVVGDSYKVAGKTYTPTDNPRYSETGYASWYGEAFHGRLTANGEVYDVNGLTAAHPTLPLPSYARVTNLENGRSMIVRVNDRGPFAKDRIIDLSSRVADMLDVKDEGTAKVEVDYVGPARMDGRDEKMLLASYEGPAASPAGSMFAWIKPQPKPRVDAPPVVFAAAAVPAPRVRPDLALYPPRPAEANPLILAPAFMPADADPLAPLIMRAGFVNSYANADQLTPAQNAADDLVNGRFRTSSLEDALATAVARRAREMHGAGDAGAVVQLGSFGDPANAARVASNFGRFGQVTTAAPAGSKPLTIVRVSVAADTVPAVIAAANATGLSGAFVLTH